MTARAILRNADAFQAGAGAEFRNYKNPEHAPVFFLDGVAHHRKRMKTQKFLPPKTVAERHHKVMRQVTDQLLRGFRRQDSAKLEDLSFRLAVEVVSESLGLSNSDQHARAGRILRVLSASLVQSKQGRSGTRCD